MSKQCPVCNSDLRIERPVEINQQVICSSCGMELVVIWLYPLELAKVLSYRADLDRKKDRKVKRR
jgi:lysine biosynthesis protein LysW